MSFMSNVFARLHKTSDSGKAYDELDKGNAINYTPKSDRYTYGNKEDSNYDKDWKPSNSEEKKTLSPEGYFRDKEGEDKQKNDMGITDQNKDMFDKKQISIPSTAIDNIQYDPETELLKVRFVGGNKTYDYPGVPLELVQAFMKAPSKGTFFMANIHDQYSLYRKNHEKKNKAQQKAIKHYVKAFVKNNAGKWKK